MWCSSCRADVAAELSTDNRRMLCARCQMELGLAAIETPRVALAPRTVEAERDARELLARWSAQNLEVPASASTNSLQKPNLPNITAENGDSALDVRKDQSLGNFPAPASTQKSHYKPAYQELTDSPLPVKTQQDALPNHETVERRKKNRYSPMRGSAIPQPSPVNELASRTEDDEPDHDRVVLNALQRQLNRGSNWATLAGQLCAYGGVGLLTCGTVLVMWSYFGGPPNYMPTGWLTAAVGQMLLFLGVVTLISSGMEQTIHEVSWRIDSLAEEVNKMSVLLEQSDGDEPPLRRSRSSGTRSRSKEDRRREVA